MFVKKLNTDFDFMLKTIERKKTELEHKINEAYDGYILNAKNFVDGLVGF
jgi:hypothetical protein